MVPTPQSSIAGERRRGPAADRAWIRCPHDRPRASTVVQAALGAALALLPAAALHAQECPPQPLASPNGPGVMVTRNCARLEGTFRDGLLQGPGKIVYPNNRTEEGTFSRGRLWGRGKIEYADGRVAVGEFVDGRLSGLGKITWPDGRLHEGMFHDGSPNGPGRSRTPRGVVSEGMFSSNGSLDGRGVQLTLEKTTHYGEFRNDRPVGPHALGRPDGSEVSEAYDPWGKRLQASLPPAPAPQATQPAAPSGAASPPDTPPPVPSVATPQPQAPAPAPSGTGVAPQQAIQAVDRAVRGLRGLLGR